MTISTVFEAKIKNDINEIKLLIKNLNAFLHSRQIIGWILYAVNIAVEEPLVNIINHGCNQDALQTIKVKVSLNIEDITILLIDDGEAFNPLSIPHLDLRKPPIDRPMGGLGMHLVRNIMQSMWYERKDDKNFFEIQISR
jgi:anti-sigma regulatory factor (Ser/Thr protein kinase)